MSSASTIAKSSVVKLISNIPSAGVLPIPILELASIKVEDQASVPSPPESYKNCPVLPIAGHT